VLSGVATSRGYWTGINCGLVHTEHTKISIFTTLITDVILLTLMLIGVLRWKESREKGGVWWLLYTQVSPSHPAGTTLILMAVGLDMGCDYHTCRSAPCGAYPVTFLYIFLMVGPQVFIILDLNSTSVCYPLRDRVFNWEPVPQFPWI
jgi:hypothetical protein